MKGKWKISGIEEAISKVLKRPDSIGIAFGGGGARGFCHIGVIRAFENFGIAPHVISGVSAGSVAVALYGAGLDSRQMQECFAGINKINNYTAWTIPRNGFLKLEKFGRLIESWLPVRYLEDMKIPTVICATDFEHGKSVGWAKGEIVPRVMASCSIPIVFPPQVINGVHYVDGGVLRNLPAWAIRKHCKTLFGSNCSPLNRDFKYNGGVIETALRSYQLMSKANTLQDINLCDHMIQPAELSGLGTFEVSKLNEAVEIGYDCASRVLEEVLAKK